MFRQPLKIGPLPLATNLLLAPIAGYCVAAHPRDTVAEPAAPCGSAGAVWLKPAKAWRGAEGWSFIEGPGYR